MTWQAHRLSLAMATGERPPKEIQARHRCDNRSCVNPGHLVWGTNGDNQRDAVERGRNSLQKRRHDGESNGHAKLVSDDVAYIRARLDAGVPRSSLAEQFHVSYDCIRLIELGKLWPSVVAKNALPESQRVAKTLPQLAPARRRAGGAR